MTSSSTNTMNKKSSSSGERGNSNNNNSMLVAVLDQTVADAAQEGGADKKETYLSVRLPCPHSGKERDYLQVCIIGHQSSESNHNHLLEIQCLEAPPNPVNKKYASWFVGNHVVANGNLYTMTRVDPLFFLLATSFAQEATTTTTTTTEQTQTQQKQWEPLEQMLAEVPAVIHACLDPKQLGHICDSYEMDQDECFYKFSQTKSLDWLQKKQQSVYHVLLQQLVDQAEQETQRSQSGGGGGAFAAGFHLTSESAPSSSNSSTNKNPAEDQENTEAEHKKTRPTEDQTRQAKHESIQVVCNYLCTEWQRAFLNHLNVKQETVLQDEQQTKKAKSAITDTPGATDNTAPFYAYAAAAVSPAADDSKSAPPPAKKTFGQKQLAKVNKKGMKSMTSFFAVKKKT